MKSIFGKLLAKINEAKKSNTGNRGMTFVEVICAVAIFSLVSVTIGGIIVFSARTYKKGVSETSIQQEAQLAANNIGNIIKDACSIQYAEMNQAVKKDGEKLEPEVIQGDGITELSIITNKNMQYSISYVAATSQLIYEEIDASVTPEVRSPQQVMAKNIVGFKADTDDFKNTRTIKLDMTVKDESTGRNIPMQYTMTSRNEESGDMKFAATSDDVVIIFLETEPTLVPGETYSIPISVVGKLTAGGLEDDGSTGVNLGTITEDYVEVTVPKDTTAESAEVRIRTKDKKADGTPKAAASTHVNIRRVESIGVTYGVDRSHSADGSYEAAGTEYTIYADVAGKNFAKTSGASWENGYKKPQAVYWSYELTAGGNTYTYESDGAGGRAYSDQAAIEQYIKIKDSKEDVDRPSLTVEIMQSMPADFKLVVTATSKHTDGVNKAGSKYPDDALNVSGEVTIEARETKVNNALEITLEPQETGEIPLNMRGGITGNVTFDFHDTTVPHRSDPTTTAVYDASTDKVKVTLGRDEEGSGTTGTGEKYTFTIDVLVNGTKKSVITVHVCRIDAVSLEVVDNFRDKEGNLMGTPTYDFRARINVDTGKNDDAMRSAVKYLIQYNADGAIDAAAVTNTLASRLTWELIDNKNNITLNKDSVICKAGVGAGNKGEIIGSYDKKYKDYYEIVNVKPARIEQDASGNWFLKQVPEIDITPRAKTDTGLPPDIELKVTVEMLHPRDGDNATTNAYNKSNKPYKDTKVEASASIEGSQTMNVYTDVVIVEPGQGTHESVQSDSEMVIPIMVKGGAVYSMDVKLSGNTSRDTKLSSYQDKEDAYGNHNPYLFSSAAGSNERTWLLGLVIGKDEKGKDGLIDVTVEGKNSSKSVIATTTFKLAVRRVNEVKVEVADGASVKDVNKAESVVTLDAYPKGYGAGGTEYFDIQRYPKDGKYRPGQICRWEEAGHGEYKSPLPMKWTMVINGQEKPLEQWTEYIAAGTVASQVDEKDYKGSVTFKLVQPLPNGTEIRATSLHTLGNVDGVKYNKSGKEYGKQYGAIKISDSIIDPDDPFEDDEIEFLSGVKRGQDYFFSNDYINEDPDNANTQNQNYERDMNLAYQNDCHWFWRVREITSIDGTNMTFGEWTKYRKCQQNSRMDKKLNAEETRTLCPDKRYQVELALLCISKDNKTLYWPYDSSVIANGTGFEGYRQGWDSSLAPTPKEKYAQTFNIGRASLAFQPGTGTKDPTGFEEIVRVNVANNGVSYLDCYKTYGTLAHPLSLKNGDWFEVNLAGYALESGHYQSGMLARVQKLENNTWVEVGATSICETIEDRKLRPLIKNIKGNAKGTYRISFKLDTYDIYYWDQTSPDPVWEPKYRQTAQSQQYLLCGSNGSAGYIYLTID